MISWVELLYAIQCLKRTKLGLKSVAIAVASTGVTGLKRTKLGLKFVAIVEISVIVKLV